MFAGGSAMAEENKDLGIGDLDIQDWGEEKSPEALTKVFSYVTGQAEDTIVWYLKRKASKRLGARFFRFSAIIATALAGLIPLFSEIYTTSGVPNISPAWASVALVIAVSFVGIDRFFGFSTAWVRFLTTELKIRNALQLFKIEWEIKSASLKGMKPNDEELLERLDMCKVFLITVNSAVENEMIAWKEEFQAALKQIDDAAQAKQEIQKMGGLTVTVKNSELFVNGWNVSIDDGLPKKCKGKTAAFGNLVPGMHVIKVFSTVKDEKHSAEKAVTIAAGGSLDIVLELE